MSRTLTRKEQENEKKLLILEALIQQAETFYAPEEINFYSFSWLAGLVSLSPSIFFRLTGISLQLSFFYQLAERMLTPAMQVSEGSFKDDRQPFSVRDLQVVPLIIHIIVWTILNSLFYFVLHRIIINTHPSVSSLYDAKKALKSKNFDEIDSAISLIKSQNEWMSSAESMFRYVWGGLISFALIYIAFFFPVKNTSDRIEWLAKFLQFVPLNIYSIVRAQEQCYSLEKRKSVFKAFLEKIIEIINENADHDEGSLFEYKNDKKTVTLFSGIVLTSSPQKAKPFNISLVLPQLSPLDVLYDVLVHYKSVHCLLKKENAIYFSYHSFVPEKDGEEIASYLTCFIEKQKQMQNIAATLETLLAGVFHRNILCVFIPKDENNLPTFKFMLDMNKLDGDLTSAIFNSLTKVFGESKVKKDLNNFIELTTVDDFNPKDEEKATKVVKANQQAKNKLISEAREQLLATSKEVRAKEIAKQKALENQQATEKKQVVADTKQDTNLEFFQEHSKRALPDYVSSSFFPSSKMGESFEAELNRQFYTEQSVKKEEQEKLEGSQKSRKPENSAQQPKIKSRGMMFGLSRFFQSQKPRRLVHFPMLKKTVDLNELEKGQGDARLISTPGQDKSNAILFWHPELELQHFDNREGDFNSFKAAFDVPIFGKNLKPSRKEYESIVNNMTPSSKNDKGGSHKRTQASFKLWRGHQDTRVYVSLEDAGRGPNGEIYRAYVANGVGNHKESYRKKNW